MHSFELLNTMFKYLLVWKSFSKISFFYLSLSNIISSEKFCKMEKLKQNNNLHSFNVRVLPMTYTVLVFARCITTSRKKLNYVPTFGTREVLNYNRASFRLLKMTVIIISPLLSWKKVLPYLKKITTFKPFRILAKPIFEF